MTRPRAALNSGHGFRPGDVVEFTDGTAPRRLGVRSGVVVGAGTLGDHYRDVAAAAGLTLDEYAACFERLNGPRPPGWRDRPAVLVEADHSPRMTTPLRFAAFPSQLRRVAAGGARRN